MLQDTKWHNQSNSKSHSGMESSSAAVLESQSIVKQESQLAKHNLEILRDNNSTLEIENKDFEHNTSAMPKITQRHLSTGPAEPGHSDFSGSNTIHA